MSTASRTPVLVGCGQVVQRSPDPQHARSPIALMRMAAERAAADAGAPKLLASLDSVRVPQGLWRYVNPGAWLAEQWGGRRGETCLGKISGTTVQQLLHDAALAIQAGRHDVVLLVGGEAEHSKRRAKAAGQPLVWDDPGGPTPDQGPGEMPDWRARPAIRAGLHSPALTFSLYEVAMRHASSETPAVHLARIARLWETFATVARDNPNAWIRSAPDAHRIATPTLENRQVTVPYTKYLVANMVVDEAAALLLCSAETAQRYGIPEHRWVFPVLASQVTDQPELSTRASFACEPALERVAACLLEKSGVEPAELACVDLYSCFPAAVQLAARALGLDGEDPLTVTGGLTFAGGPFNSYVLHALATTMARLRAAPGSMGLVSGVGGFMARHAMGLYASRPPERPFQVWDLTEEAAGLPGREFAEEAAGDVAVETYSVAYDRSGPQRGVVAARTPQGARTWAQVSDPDLLARLATEDLCEAHGRIAADRELSL